MPRRLVAALAVGAGLALASLFVTAGLLFYHPLPTIDGTWRLLGLRERGEIVRDAHGIPHVDARNLRDLFFLQGYATAQDRLLQMELLRAGTDRVGAPADLTVDPSTRESLEAYAEGVSKFIAQHGERALPGELVLAGRRPRPWTPEDTLGIIARLGPGRGSACWTVPGSRAFKGRPLLAAELRAAAPGPGWYEVSLDGGGFRAVGASLPGVPAILAGHDGWIAWSVVGASPSRETAAPILEALLRVGRARDAGAFRAALAGGVAVDACYADVTGATGKSEAGVLVLSPPDRASVVADVERSASVSARLEAARAVDVDAMRLLLRSPTGASRSTAAYRLVVDLAELDASRAVLSTGQSGQRASSHFSDQTPLWEAGQLHELSFSRRSLGRIEGHLVFRPR